jgi:diaminopimelate epimerase
MRFSKWHGLGNDYLLIERDEAGGPLTPDLVRRLCDSHFGIGSDGVLEVVSVDGSEAELVIWNPDGSTAEMSGNGSRIAARWLARRTSAHTVRLRVGPREVVARMRSGANVELELGPVEVGQGEQLDLDGETVDFVPVSVGNPHAVIRRDFDETDIHVYGPLIEHHPRFPAGTNVQLVRVLDPHEIAIAVWERGAGPTLSSGSSSVAAAAASVANGWCESPVTVVLRGAGDLLVELDEGFNARLTGPAQEICSGEVSEELLAEVNS